MADIDVHVTRELRASPQQVWAVIEDLRRTPEWLAFASEVHDLSAPTAAPGVRYSVKPGGRMEPTTSWQITEAEAPRRLVQTSEMPMLSGARSELELRNAGEGTEASVHWHATPKGLPGKLMRGMFQKRITENWERSLERLDELASRG